MAEPAVALLLEQLQAAVPARMRELPQWLLWRYEVYDGDKKPRKVPYYVSGRKRRGVQGSVEDRAELQSFAIALTHLPRGRWDGLGFAFLEGDGLIGIDLDRAIDADGVVSDRCAAIVQACASYTEYSPSGTGAHIIVDGQTQSFKSNDVGVEVFCGRQFFTFTGRRWAGTPAEVAPIDATTLARLRATVKGAKAGARPTASAPDSGPPADDLRARLEGALAVLPPDMAHDDWVQVGMALRQALGDAGLALWDYWSSKGSKYPGHDALARKWASFTGSGITEATVFKMAASAGWRPPRTRKARAAVAPAAASADTPSGASGGGGGDGPAPPPEDEPAAAPAGRPWRRQLLGEGGTKDCRENVYLHLTHNAALAGLVGYDQFAHQVMKLKPPPWKSTPGEWTTNDDYLLGMWLAQHERMTIKSEATLVAGVAMAAFAGAFHPVLQYLDGLPAWDGIERLAHWLPDCLGAKDTTYTRMVGPWFLMGMVRRVRDPGCQHDYMIVLEGLQGKRKSTALRALAVRDEWFSDTPVRVGSPDALLSLAGKWVYELAEMDAFNKAETTAVKAYVTSRSDRVREPYARRHVDRPRSGVLVGSTNQAEYFRDPTGARRFWPIACDGDIDLDKLRSWRDQLFAEAQHRLSSDDPEQRRCWPTLAEERQYLVPEQEAREIADPWSEKLASWLDSRTNYGESGLEVREVDSFTVVDLLTRALQVPLDRIDGNRQMATRVGISMHRLGWHKRRDATGPRVWRYWRPGVGAASDGSAGGPAADGDVAGGLSEF